LNPPIFPLLNLPFPPFIKEGGGGFKSLSIPLYKRVNRRGIQEECRILYNNFLIFLSVHPHIPFCKVENMGISGGDERKYKKDN